MENNDEMVEALGEDFVRAYAATRRQEINDFNDDVTEWDRELYVEMF